MWLYRIAQKRKSIFYVRVHAFFFSFDKTQKALSLDALTEGTVMCKSMEGPTPQNYNTTLMCYAPPGETSLDIP